jgi:manganese transport protein
MAGQVIMQGFVGFRIPVWMRRLVTMLPAFAAALYGDPMKTMLSSQVVLSFVLPLPLVALVVLSSRSSVMGAFATARSTVVVAGAATVLIVALNAALLIDLL